MLAHSAASSYPFTTSPIPGFLPYQDSLVWYYDMSSPLSYGAGSSAVNDIMSTDSMQIINGTYSSNYKGGVYLNGTDAWLSGSADVKYKFDGHANNWTWGMIASMGNIDEDTQFLFDADNATTAVGYRITANTTGVTNYGAGFRCYDGSTALDAKSYLTEVTDNKFYAIVLSKYTNNIKFLAVSADGGQTQIAGGFGTGVNLSTLNNDKKFTIGCAMSSLGVPSLYTQMTVHAFMGWNTNIDTMSTTAGQTQTQWVQSLADNYYNR